MLKLGDDQFKTDWMDKLVTCKIPVRDPILLNFLNLPGNRNQANKDPVLTAANMKKSKMAANA